VSITNPDRLSDLRMALQADHAGVNSMAEMMASVTSHPTTPDRLSETQDPPDGNGLDTIPSVFSTQDVEPYWEQTNTSSNFASSSYDGWVRVYLVSTSAQIRIGSLGSGSAIGSTRFNAMQLKIRHDGTDYAVNYGSTFSRYIAPNEELKIKIFPDASSDMWNFGDELLIDLYMEYVNASGGNSVDTLVQYRVNPKYLPNGLDDYTFNWASNTSLGIRKQTGSPYTHYEVDAYISTSDAITNPSIPMYNGSKIGITTSLQYTNSSGLNSGSETRVRFYTNTTNLYKTAIFRKVSGSYQLYGEIDHEDGTGGIIVN
jgi:hypothetical protein